MVQRRRGFGRLRRERSGRYSAAYIGPDLRLHRAPDTFKAKIDAEGWLASERREIDLDQWIPPDRRHRVRVAAESGQTVGSYATRWLADRRERDPHDPMALRPSSVKDYEILINKHILPSIGKIPFAEIEPSDIEAWYRALGARKTPRARAKAYGLLRTILNAAKDDPNVPLTENPAHIKGAGRVPRSTQIHPATLDELAVITEAMPDELRLAVQLGAWCALRYGEVFELRRKDLDLVTGVVHVRRGVVWTNGTVTTDRPKTNAGIRDVVIPPHLMPMVTLHLERHVEKRQDALLFPDDRGRNQRPPTFARPWHAARAAAGRDDLKFHHLRHTGAVLAAQSGATLADLMGRLGHTTPAMAMIYQHTAADRDRLIAERLSQIALGNQSRLRVNASRSPAKPRRARSTALDQPTLLDA
jgi:integrase